jgi:hypothetical protein
MNEQQLQALALQVQQHPMGTTARRIILSKLIDTIYRSRQLARPYQGQFQGVYEDIYQEAVQNLFLYICKNIDKYDPQRGEFMTWVNMLLTKRFFPEAIPKVIGTANEINLESSILENNFNDSEDVTEEYVIWQNTQQNEPIVECCNAVGGNITSLKESYSVNANWVKNIFDTYEEIVTTPNSELLSSFDFDYSELITYGNHLRKLGQIRDACIESKAWTGAVNAEIARGKAAGLYVERKEILHGSLDKMSEKELENELKRLMEEFSTVVDVSSEEIEDPIAIKV